MLKGVETWPVTAYQSGFMNAQVIFSVGVQIPGGGMGNHAYYLVDGLRRHELLHRAYVMRTGRDILSSPAIQTAYWTERVAYRLARHWRKDQYVLRDNLFDLWVSRHVKDADIFYGWTHHALYSLKQAKRRGMITVLERANAHPLTMIRLLEEEHKRHGIQAPVYHPLTLKKHLQELEIADYIAVTSQWTRQSLLEHGIAEQRILLTPLGVDATQFHPATKPADGQFRVVYVGQLRLRKGVQYLLEAWEKLKLKQAELILVGEAVPHFEGILREYLQRNPTITLFGHAETPAQLYQQASACILPTLEDGFGLVVLEAMACGVPVIVTEQTGAKDCVRPGVDGFVIPAGNAESIAHTLEYCHRNQEQLRQMGQEARQQAEAFSWMRYQDGIVSRLREIA